LPVTAPPCSWQSRRVAVVASGNLITASARLCGAWRHLPLAGCFWPRSLFRSAMAATQRPSSRRYPHAARWGLYTQEHPTTAARVVTVGFPESPTNRLPPSLLRAELGRDIGLQVRMRCVFKCAWLDDNWVHVPATERIKKCAGVTQASSCCGAATRNIKREKKMTVQWIQRNG
jgi:hypothetical protein